MGEKNKGGLISDRRQPATEQKASHAQAEFRPHRLFGRGEESGTPAEVVEMGDLPCRQIKPDTAVDIELSHHGGGQQGRKSGTQAAAGPDFGLTPRKESAGHVDLALVAARKLFIAQ